MPEKVAQIRYTVPEAARILHVSVPTVWRRIKAGQIQTIRDGWLVFITHNELHRYAKRGTSTLKVS